MIHGKTRQDFKLSENLGQKTIRDKEDSPVSVALSVGIVQQIKRLLVQFLVWEHAWVACSVPS